MTPAAKAQELIQKFRHLAHTGRDKHCAHIVVDGIIEEVKDLQSNCLLEFPLSLEYWESVRSAISSL